MITVCGQEIVTPFIQQSVRSIPIIVSLGLMVFYQPVELIKYNYSRNWIVLIKKRMQTNMTVKDTENK